MKNDSILSLQEINLFRMALAGIVSKVVHDRKHALFPGGAGQLAKISYCLYNPCFVKTNF